MSVVQNTFDSDFEVYNFASNEWESNFLINYIIYRVWYSLFIAEVPIKVSNTFTSNFEVDPFVVNFFRSRFRKANNKFRYFGSGFEINNPINKTFNSSFIYTDIAWTSSFTIGN